MSKLESLSLQKIKGASNPLLIEFRNDVNFTVIFGENGTGKSSIVDGFDFICNESLGSIEDKSLGTTSKGKFVTTLGNNTNDLEIKLKYSKNEWISKYSSRLIPATKGPTPRPNTKILRKEKILEFITKKPGERYESIKSFIETPNCDNLSNVVNELKKSKENEYNESVRALTQSRDSLEKSWISEGKNGKDSISWAKGEIKDDVKDLVKEKTEIKIISECFAKIEIALSNIETEKVKYEESQKNTELKLKEYNSLLEKESSSNDKLIYVLQSAEQFFESSNDLKSCPVCEQTIFQNEVQERIKVKLKSFQEIVKSKNEYDNLLKNEEKQKQNLIREQHDLISNCIKIYAIIKVSEISDVKSLNINYNEYSDFESEKPVDKSQYELTQKFFNEIKTLKDYLAVRPDEVSKKIDSYNLIKSQLVIIEEKTIKAQELESLNKNIKSLNDIINNTRNRFIERLLQSIEADIDNMYQKIHPNENIGAIKLKMDEKKRASLDITAKFCSKENILPQAYYSESHIDTLGICIFIGLAKLFKTEDTILIFDDIVTSADQIHLSRFLKMLHDETKHFQHTIITTHYQIWRDKYRYGSGNVQLIELMDWSLNRGIRHSKTKLYVEELKNFRNVEPMDKQIVASKAGIFLELILDNLALLYRCKLPRKYEQVYTLGEFLNCFSSSLKKNMKVEVVVNDIVVEEFPLLDKLKVLPENSDIRNKVGCHHNEFASYSNNDIKEMVDNTIALSEILICSDCGELPFRNRSGSYYECKCKSKRLYPLVERD